MIRYKCDFSCSPFHQPFVQCTHELAYRCHLVKPTKLCTNFCGIIYGKIYLLYSICQKIYSCTKTAHKMLGRMRFLIVLYKTINVLLVTHHFWKSFFSSRKVVLSLFSYFLLDELLKFGMISVGL
jgi:hypothetical protein